MATRELCLPPKAFLRTCLRDLQSGCCHIKNIILIKKYFLITCYDCIGIKTYNLGGSRYYDYNIHFFLLVVRERRTFPWACKRLWVLCLRLLHLEDKAPWDPAPRYLAQPGLPQQCQLQVGPSAHRKLPATSPAPRPAQSGVPAPPSSWPSANTASGPASRKPSLVTPPLCVMLHPPGTPSSNW